MIIKILAGIFVLGIVILVHEIGHFAMAKACGVFVKTFSIGFGKKILKKRVGDTQYALSVLPFGGYVKFAGETSEENKEKEADRDDEIPDGSIDPSRYFRNKRGLVKGAVVFAGPLMNYLLAALVYILVYYSQGIQVLPSTSIGYVEPGSAADSLGLRVGDKILMVDSVRVEDWRDVSKQLSRGPGEIKALRVKRGAEELAIQVGRARDWENRYFGIGPLVPPRVGIVKRNSPAAKAGIARGAVIESVNDTLLSSYRDLERMTHANPGRPIVVKWSLEGTAHTDTLVPEPREVPKEGDGTETRVIGQIGVGPYYERIPVGLAEAVGGGFYATHDMIRMIASILKKYFTREASLKTLGGPIMIVQMAGEMANWGFNYLLYFLAFFSVNLFIFNLLPLLPFDGGHLFFFAVEGITRRPVKDRVKEVLTQVGFILLILLMAYVVLLDLSRCSGVSPGVL